MPSSTRVAQIVVLTAATVLMMGFGGFARGRQVLR